MEPAPNTSRGKRPVADGPYCAATYVSIARTCPDSCAFKVAGCYVRAGFTRVLSDRLDADAVGLTPESVIEEEARLIERAFNGARGAPGGQVPQDGARGGRDLRLHVGGDVPSVASAVRLAVAAVGWTKRGGGRVWSYTHNWRSIPRFAFGSISVLASVETIDDAAAAWRRGYVPAIVVQRFPSVRRFRLENESASIDVIPCPAETRAPGQRPVTCVECRLCLDDTALAQRGTAIGFAVHGHQADRVHLPVL